MGASQKLRDKEAPYRRFLQRELCFPRAFPGARVSPPCSRRIDLKEALKGGITTRRRRIHTRPQGAGHLSLFSRTLIVYARYPPAPEVLLESESLQYVAASPIAAVREQRRAVRRGPPTIVAVERVVVRKGNVVVGERGPTGRVVSIVGHSDDEVRRRDGGG